MSCKSYYTSQRPQKPLTHERNVTCTLHYTPNTLHRLTSHSIASHRTASQNTSTGLHCITLNSVSHCNLEAVQCVHGWWSAVDDLPLVSFEWLPLTSILSTDACARETQPASFEVFPGKEPKGRKDKRAPGSVQRLKVTSPQQFIIASSATSVTGEAN